MFGFNVIDNKINSALKNNSRRHNFFNLDNISKVLILFTYKDWNDIREIAGDLENSGKQVILWTIQSHRGAETEISFPSNVKVISQKEISRWRGLSSSVIEEFQKLEYDTLLDLTTKDDKSLQYLLVSNSAEFCVGIKQPEHKIFDFVLLKEENTNLKETYGQIKFYLNNMH